MDIAVAYYTAMAAKNITGMEKYLHTDVLLITPLAEVTSKEAVLEAAKKLITFLKTIRIRAKFCSDDQVMLAYDFDFPAPIGLLRAAALMTLQDELITKIELFYDGRPFDMKKNEIFS